MLNLVNIPNLCKSCVSEIENNETKIGLEIYNALWVMALFGQFPNQVIEPDYLY